MKLPSTKDLIPQKLESLQEAYDRVFLAAIKDGLIHLEPADEERSFLEKTFRRGRKFNIFITDKSEEPENLAAILVTAEAFRNHLEAAMKSFQLPGNETDPENNPGFQFTQYAINELTETTQQFAEMARDRAIEKNPKRDDFAKALWQELAFLKSQKRLSDFKLVEPKDGDHAGRPCYSLTLTERQRAALSRTWEKSKLEENAKEALGEHSQKLLEEQPTTTVGNISPGGEGI